MAYSMTLIRAVSQVMNFARQGNTSALDGAGIGGPSNQSDAQRAIFDTLYAFAAGGHPGFLYRGVSYTASAGGVIAITDPLVVKVKGATGKWFDTNFRLLNGEVFAGNTSAIFGNAEVVLLDTYKLPDTQDTAACFEKLDAQTQHEIVQEASRAYRATKNFDPSLDGVMTRRMREFNGLVQQSDRPRAPLGTRPLGGSFGGGGNQGGGGGQ
jgi:hypothetical protein